MLLDAQATGMPVISTRHCDISEEVLDGRTGLLVDEKDVDGLVAAMKQFYDMPQAEFDAFAEAASDHVRTNYDVKECARQLSITYSDMVEQSEGSNLSKK